MANERDCWLKFRVRVRFRDLLLGGVPLDPNVIEGWINSRPNLKEIVAAEREAIIREHQAETAEALTPEQMQALQVELMTGFRTDQGGPYVESRQIRACFREAATTSGMMLRLKGGSKGIGLKQTLQHGFVVKAVPDNPKGAIYIGKKAEELEIVRSVAHVNGPQGPRSCFKMAQAARGVELTFDAWLMNNGCVSEGEFGELCQYIGEVGLGKDRSQDFGKFDVVEVTPL